MPLPLSLNRLYRANYKTRRIHKSTAYKRWVRTADALWMAQKAPGKPQMIEGYFRVRVTLYPPNRRRRDGDNTLKILMDYLQRIELIRDDADCREHTAVWGEVRRDASCCVVELEEYQP